jgi:hypothetical protein
VSATTLSARGRRQLRAIRSSAQGKHSPACNASAAGSINDAAEDALADLRENLGEIP